MLRRQTNIAAASQRLFQSQWQSILVAAGDQRCARGRTDGGVGVGLQKAHTPDGHAIDVRRAEIGTPVARYVGIAEIISHDEDDVRRSRYRLPENVFNARGKRDRSGGSAAQQRSTAHIM